MIKVDRASVAEPTILITKNADLHGERNKIIQYHENGIGVKVDFSLYSKPEVKEALRTLFNHKCAYCESRVSHIDHGDVEHWRPKGGVTGQSGHKGYYWLASEWDNLLLACSICNGKGYKGNHFPLAAGYTYATKSKDDYRTLEKPLLINPCETDPTNHFGFNHLGFIKGLTIEGKQSVLSYGLHRDLLTMERKKEAEVVARELRQIIELIADTIRDNSRSSINKRKIKEIVSFLRKRVSSEYQYAGMSRRIIRNFQSTYKNNLVFVEWTKKILKGY
ncbi:hypothetical protein [Peribacillus sp. SI8-4]|uniref:hypothetical protein n=1 Tax=Peribacillus sp. SI8-4 TaxID=3048009 RepID=UPI0025565C9E|nr:hypothetical protein [Peribacillus sp. SI8-4]